MIISKRQLELQSYSVLPSLEERQKGRIIGPVDDRLRRAEVMIDTETGEIIEDERSIGGDLLRYLMGAMVHLVGAGGNKQIINLLEIDTDNITIREDEILISPYAQETYRIPFSKIIYARGTDISTSTDTVVTKKGRIGLHFADIGHLAAFASRAALQEFFATGSTTGPVISAILADPRFAEDDESEKARKLNLDAYRTFNALLIPRDAPIGDPSTGAYLVSRSSAPYGYHGEDRRTDLDESELIFSRPYNQFSINWYAQMSETALREFQDELTTLKFLVDENYNFFDNKFEINSKKGYLPEFLLPSSTVLSYLNNALVFRPTRMIDGRRRTSEEEASFRNLWNSLREILRLDRQLSNGGFTSEPMGVGPARNLTKGYFRGFGNYLQVTSPENIITELADLIEKSKNIIIDPKVIKEYPNKSQFPFYNEIILTDLGRASKNVITRDLIRETNSKIYKRCSLRLASLDGLSVDATKELFKTVNGVEPDISVLTFAAEDTYGTTPAQVETNLRIKKIPYDAFLSSFLDSIVNFDGLLLASKTAEARTNTHADLEDIYNNHTTSPFSNQLIKTDTLSLLEAIEFFETLSTLAKNKLKEFNFSIKDLLLNKKNYTEIFAYKIRKTNLETNLIQNFFIINDTERTNEFIDSQIKYDTEYRYDVFAYTLIAGHDYIYKHPRGGFQGEDTFVDLTPYNLIFETDVEFKQTLQVLEVPLVFEGSVNIDSPPIRPIVQFYPLKDTRDKIKIRLSRASGTLIEQPVRISDEDLNRINRIRINQKRTDGKILFRSDENPIAFEVYRMTERPTSALSFAGSGRRVLNALNGRQTSGVVFDDTIVPNVVYYYLFRTIDNHGNISNPTDVFKFVLVMEEGALLPLMETIPLSELNIRKEYSKEFRRFALVEPSTYQKEMVHGQFDDRSSRDVTSVQFTTADKGDSVLNNRFLLEVSSLSTGKKMYIEMNNQVNNRLLSPDAATEEEVTVADAEPTSPPPPSSSPLRQIRGGAVVGGDSAPEFRTIPPPDPPGIDKPTKAPPTRIPRNTALSELEESPWDTPPWREPDEEREPGSFD